jgi:predicted dehydrogenase
MALSSMENGKHAAVEVPLAYTLEDLWKLVDTSETTRRHCIML